MRKAVQVACCLVLLLAVLPSIAQIKHVTPLYKTGNEVSLDGTWKFKFFRGWTTGTDTLFFQNGYDISQWSDIQVPGHWGFQGFTEPTYGEIPAMVGLYKRTFDVPTSCRGKQVFLRFEGVLSAYEVYVNGEEVGEWASSYNGAAYNITKMVNFDKPNQLAVRVSSRSREYRFDIADNWTMSGIQRTVELFCTPNIHIDDYTIRTTVPDSQSANMEVEVLLQSDGSPITQDYSIEATLYSPSGNMVRKASEPVHGEACSLGFSVENPMLWSAETPTLYTMSLKLMQNGKELQNIRQKIGIREITIDKGILKLNGMPLKMRGVNWHDLDPDGKVLSKESILKDIQLMKEGNINMVRASHYPPDRRKLDLCDSLGIYVICEVPFGFGDELLPDTSYRRHLLNRAHATVKRDKNRSCVIIWSIGNENPITQIAKETGLYVKAMDHTRPILYPGSNEEDYRENPVGDILSPHYSPAEWVLGYQDNDTLPAMMTEYGHSLGLASGEIGNTWRAMFSKRNFAGGAIWHFQDQGLKWTADTKPTAHLHDNAWLDRYRNYNTGPVNTKALESNIWMDSIHYYKSNIEGTDGIIYSDRTPQADYWLVRKVYSPVQIIEREVACTSQPTINVYNQYDFLNLNTVRGQWKLYKNRDVHDSGEIIIDCQPHDTVQVTIPISIPKLSYNDDVWYMTFSFVDKEGTPIYEHTIHLTKSVETNIMNAYLDWQLKSKKSKLKVKEIGNGLKSVQGKDFIYTLGTGSLFLDLNVNGKPVIERGILARAGRVPKLADYTILDRFYNDTKDYYWNPFLLKASEVKNMEFKEESRQVTYIAQGIFPRGSLFPNQSLQGEVKYSIDQAGELKVDYDLKPVNASGYLLDAGISFKLAPSITHFQWLGNGPYAAYPDKWEYNDFGIHALHKDDLNFNGNRSQVWVATLTDGQGNGIAVVGNKADIGVELINGHIVLSRNSLVSGVGAKKTYGKPSYKATDVKQIKGSITLIPLVAGKWPHSLVKILGYPNADLKPFTPYFYSYDTSK